MSTLRRNLESARSRFRGLGWRHATAPGIALGVAFALSCSSPTESCKVNGVTVTPGSAQLTVGGTSQLVAAVSSSNCSTVPTASWSSSAAGVATVSGTGLVTAVGEGTTTITATAEGSSGTATVTVSPAPVATLEIQPSSGNVVVGTTTQLAAVARDQAGQVLTGRTVTWQTLSAAVASVSASGLVTGLSAGQATITATAEGRTAIALITVSPAPVATVTVALNENNLTPGQATQALATLLDAQSNALTGRTVSWNSSNGAVASIDQFGAISAIAPGQTTITATAEGKSGQAVLTVSQVPVASVALSVPQATMQVGASQNATATALSANGSILVGRLVTWQSSNVAVALISSGGTITALGPGITVITATIEGQFAVAAVSVANPVATVEVSLAAGAINVGQTTQATAVAKDGSGTVLPGVAIVFGVANPAVASVSANGLVTALTVGVTNITATAGAIAGNVQLTVNPIVVPVASVDVTPASQTISVGATFQFAAQPKGAANQNLDGRVVTWSSSNETVATVSPNGLVTAVAAGNAMVFATSEGIQGSATLTVQVQPVATVTVSASATTAAIGVQITAMAVLKDAGGNILTGRAIVWSSSNQAVATVSNDGLVATIGLGTTTITATSEGQSGSVVITVVGFPVLSLSNATPGSNATSVGIETAIVLTFSENIDPATVTASTVTLTTGGIAVAANRTVSGKVVTVTPTSPLAEFLKVYQVGVTTGLRSQVGNTLPNATQWTFTTVLLDANFYYIIKNDLSGTDHALDTYSDTFQCFMSTPAGVYSGHYWLISPAPAPYGSFYTFTNSFGGVNKTLTGQTNNQCLIADLAPPAYFDQLWIIVASGVADRWYIRNLDWGGTSLSNAAPFPALRTSAAVADQRWSFTRSFHK
ncbi:MAG TPA: Ig-like domain-containing protein [Gemmatimonadaceae bacterium]